MKDRNGMTQFNFDQKRFVGVENYDDGDLTKEVIFHYHQDGTVIRGTFEGGRVIEGKLLAEILEDGRLDMIWRYTNVDGDVVYGTCVSTPELLPDGRYRLHESWTITGGPNQGESGQSVIEEIRNEE